jgi:hypothetical protein
MSSKNHLKNLIVNYNRRLEKLREQQALYGMSVDPKILIEIEDIEAQIESLQAELKRGESQPEPTLQIGPATPDESEELRPPKGESSMEPTMIATAVVAILSSYLAKAGEAAAEKAGVAAWHKATEIYQTIKARFVQEEDNYPAQTLKQFEERPASRKSALKEVLEELLNQDVEFAQSLTQLLKEVDKSGGKTVFNVNVFGGQVGEVINIDKLEGGLTINKKD